MQNMVNWENFESSLFMKSLSMPLNIEHSLEHVSIPSASSEDYYHQTFHAKLAYSLEQNTEAEGGALPYWKVR